MSASPAHRRHDLNLVFAVASQIFGSVWWNVSMVPSAEKGYHLTSRAVLNDVERYYLGILIESLSYWIVSDMASFD